MYDKKIVISQTNRYITITMYVVVGFATETEIDKFLMLNSLKTDELHNILVQLMFTER